METRKQIELQAGLAIDSALAVNDVQPLRDLFTDLKGQGYKPDDYVFIVLGVIRQKKNSSNDEPMGKREFIQSRCDVMAVLTELNFPMDDIHLKEARDILMEAVDLENTDAMCVLGELYQNNRPQDVSAVPSIVVAIDWFTKAKEKGNKSADAFLKKALEACDPTLLIDDETKKELQSSVDLACKRDYNEFDKLADLIMSNKDPAKVYALNLMLHVIQRDYSDLDRRDFACHMRSLIKLYHRLHTTKRLNDDDYGDILNNAAQIDSHPDDVYAILLRVIQLRTISAQDSSKIAMNQTEIIELLQKAVKLDCPVAMCMLADIYEKMPPSADNKENATRKKDASDLLKQAADLGYKKAIGELDKRDKAKKEEDELKKEEDEFKKELQTCIIDAYDHHDFIRFEDLRLLIIDTRDSHTEPRAFLRELLEKEQEQIVGTSITERVESEAGIKQHVIKSEKAPSRAYFAKTLLLLMRIMEIRNGSLHMQANPAIDKELESAIKFLDGRIGKDDVYAMLVRASMYSNGLGEKDGESNDQQAIKLYEQAIKEYRCPQAMLLLAQIYERMPRSANESENITRHNNMIALLTQAKSLGLFTAEKKLWELAQKDIHVQTAPTLVSASRYNRAPRHNIVGADDPYSALASYYQSAPPAEDVEAIRVLASIGKKIDALEARKNKSTGGEKKAIEDLLWSFSAVANVIPKLLTYLRSLKLPYNTPTSLDIPNSICYDLPELFNAYDPDYDKPIKPSRVIKVIFSHADELLANVEWSKDKYVELKREFFLDILAEKEHTMMWETDPQTGMRVMDPMLPPQPSKPKKSVPEKKAGKATKRTPDEDSSEEPSESSTQKTKLTTERKAGSRAPKLKVPARESDKETRAEKKEEKTPRKEKEPATSRVGIYGKKPSVKEPTAPKTFSILVLGNVGDGRHSLVKAYCSSEFRKEPPSTSRNEETKITIHDADCKLTFQFKQQGSKKTFVPNADDYRDRNAIILVCDLSNKKALEELKKWKVDIDQNNHEDHTIPVYVVPTKADKDTNQAALIRLVEFISSDWQDATVTAPVSLVTDINTASRAINRVIADALNHTLDQEGVAGAKRFDDGKISSKPSSPAPQPSSQ